MRLSKYEKETIILTSEGDDTVQIYTFNASLKRRLAEYAEKYPHLARLDRWTSEGSGTYVSEITSCVRGHDHAGCVGKIGTAVWME